MTKKRQIIEVTEADIEAAVPKDSGHCAIADAIGRQLPGVTNVTVDLQSIRWTDREAGERYTYLTPRVAQALLLDFDNGDRDYCQPMTFRLDKPVHTAPIKSSSAPKAARQAVSRAERVAVIEAKIAAGETLTPKEKRSLTTARAWEARPRPARPRSEGPKRIEQTGSHDPDGAPEITVVGGQPAPLGALAHGRGKRRQFGIKSAGSPLPHIPAT